MKPFQSYLDIEGITLEVKTLAKHETPEYIQIRIQEVLQNTLQVFLNQQQLSKSLQESEIVLVSDKKNQSILQIDSTSSNSTSGKPSGDQLSSDDQTFVKDIEQAFVSINSQSGKNVMLGSQTTQEQDTAINTILANDYLQKVIQEKLKTLEYQIKNSPKNETLQEEKVYWTDILHKLQNGESYESFFTKKDHERFTDFYVDFIATYPMADEFKTINWEETRKKMIVAIEGKLLKQSYADPYWAMLIAKLSIPNIDVLQLFTDYQELFLILRDVFEVDMLPLSINITSSSKKVYPKLFTDNIYANIGTSAIYDELRNLKISKVDGAYQILRVLDEVVVSNVGERYKNEDGSSPALLEGQWYVWDRVGDSIKPGSSFWNACVYNTENEKAYLYKTIEQRHAYYKFADAYLKSLGIVNEWFDAAAKVTMNNLFTAEVTVGAASKGAVTSYFLSGDTNDFLRGGNEFLLAHNMKNLQALIEGKGTINLSFIDANGQQQTFEGLTKKQLDFKLVEFEQSLVQEYINKYIKDNKTESSFIKFLEKYDIYDTPRENLKDILDEINGLFQGKIIKEGVDITPYITKVVNQAPYVHIKDFSFIAEDGTEFIIEKHFTDDNGSVYFDFNNYKHRVKLGQLMVEELYYQREKDILIDKLEIVRQNPDEFIADIPETFKDYVDLDIPDKRMFLKDYYQEFKNDLQALDRIIINHEDHEIFSADFIEEKLKTAYQTFIETWQKNNPEFMDDIEKFYKDLVKDYEDYKEKATEALKNIEDIPKAVQQDVINTIEETLKIKENEITSLQETAKTYESIKNTFNEGVKLYEEKTEELRKLKNTYVTKEKFIKTALDTGASMLKELAQEIYPDIVNVKGNDEKKKDKLFEESAEATVAILVYEFLEGEGTTPREFYYDKHPFAKAMFQGRILEEIIKEVVDNMERNKHDFKNVTESENYKVDLEFSPSIKLGKKIIKDYKNTSIEEKYKLISGLIESGDKHLNSNWTQLFIGGGTAYVYIKDKEVHIKIENFTSKSSFALHMLKNEENNKKGKNGKRPIFSTIKQEIYFSFKLP